VLIIGNDVQLNDSVHIGAAELVEIGDHTLIASRVFITDHSHGVYDRQDNRSRPEVIPVKRPIVAKPVHIGRNVWIGEQVCVLPGVRIGDGVVIGAGSVVTRDIPAQCVAAGNPARVIRQWDEDAQEWKRV
jgi:lipopolysaccharide O-acetyltransferase